MKVEGKPAEQQHERPEQQQRAAQAAARRAIRLGGTAFVADDEFIADDIVPLDWRFIRAGPGALVERLPHLCHDNSLLRLCEGGLGLRMSVVVGKMCDSRVD